MEGVFFFIGASQPRSKLPQIEVKVLETFGDIRSLETVRFPLFIDGFRRIPYRPLVAASKRRRNVDSKLLSVERRIEFKKGGEESIRFLRK